MRQQHQPRLVEQMEHNQRALPTEQVACVLVVCVRPVCMYVFVIPCQLGRFFNRLCNYV